MQPQTGYLSGLQVSGHIQVIQTMLPAETSTSTSFRLGWGNKLMAPENAFGHTPCRGAFGISIGDRYF
jgi:hypothetical protein